MKKHIKYIVFAFALGIGLAMSWSVSWGIIVGANGITDIPIQQEKIPEPQTIPIIKQTFETPVSNYSQAVTPVSEETRLQAIEARLTALELKVK